MRAGACDLGPTSTLVRDHQGADFVACTYFGDNDTLLLVAFILTRILPLQHGYVANVSPRR